MQYYLSEERVPRDRERADTVKDPVRNRLLAGHQQLVALPLTNTLDGLRRLVGNNLRGAHIVELDQLQALHGERLGNSLAADAIKRGLVEKES